MSERASQGWFRALTPLEKQVQSGYIYYALVTTPVLLLATWWSPEWMAVISATRAGDVVSYFRTELAFWPRAVTAVLLGVVTGAMFTGIAVQATTTTQEAGDMLVLIVAWVFADLLACAVTVALAVLMRGDR